MKVLAREPLSDAAKEILAEMDYSVVETREPEIMFEWRDDSLWLLDGRTRQSPVRVDFISDWQKLKIGKDDLLAKAVGLRRGLKHVVDATAGWGQDSLRLLKLGCHVTAIERSPVLLALLQDGLRRAGQDPRWVAGGGARLRLMAGDASEILPKLPKESREVIFIDPMFPERKKGALAKGEMQLLHSLLGAGEDSLSLWNKAWDYSERRLVYKSPRLTPGFPRPPDLEFEGRAIRYDVWLRTP